MFLSLQQRLRVKVDAKERITVFMPDNVAYLSNRHIQGEDGKVSYDGGKSKEADHHGIGLWREIVV